MPVRVIDRDDGFFVVHDLDTGERCRPSAGELPDLLLCLGVDHASHPGGQGHQG